MLVPGCEICGGPLSASGVKRGRRTGQEFALIRCRECGFAFVEEPLTDLSQIYDAAYYRGEGSDPHVSYAFEFERPDITIRNYEWSGIELFMREHQWEGKILDFGSGSGGLVRYLLRSGHLDVFGYDIGEWSGRAKASGLPILDEAELASHEGTFDLIFAIEVVEHIVNPVKLFEQFRRLLKPGGRLFLTTGNAQKAPRNFANWYYVMPEIHVSYFSPKSLSLLMQKTGFKPVNLGWTTGWEEIIRFKILKNLGFKRVNALERMLPWGALTRMADMKLGFTAQPFGLAI